MAWVAVDRAVKTIEHFGLDGPLAHWKRLRQAIHQEVCEKGYNPTLGAFVQFYDSSYLDASLLMIPLVGFLPVTDPRVQGTIAAIERYLTHDGFVYRYGTKSGVDGLPGSEGTFLLCTFWMVDNLALSGRRPEARQLYEKLLALRNDLGLLAEEYDPTSGHLLGNFPQAFSHVALVNSAWNLFRTHGPAERRQRQE
jgi:GH15 family glucan-1,4-alpha-glucosidase